MYFGSSLEGIFSTAGLVFFAVVFGLGVWKVIDIIMWLFQHISISWS